MKQREEKTVYVFDSTEKPIEIYNSENEATNAQKSIFDWCSSIMSSFVVIFVIFSFLFRIVQVSGTSMLQTLQDGDWLMIHNTQKIEYGDIIVSKPSTYEKGPVIKRVIGVAGDEIYIDFERGDVIVNGVKLDEPYINTPTTRNYDVYFPVTVPEGCVFVMGDNRNGSLDSRSSEIGMIQKNYILGKVVLRVFPFKKIEYKNMDGVMQDAG